VWFYCQTLSEQRESQCEQPRWVEAGDLSQLSYRHVSESDSAPLVTRPCAHRSSLRLNQPK